MLPRPAGTFVAPHQFNWKLDFDLDDPSLYKGAFLLTNNPDEFLLLGSADVNKTMVPSHHVENLDSTYFSTSPVCFDAVS